MDNKDLLKCGHCHKWFEYEELKIRFRDLYGITVKEKTCPYCGNVGFTRMSDEEYMSKFDYTNDVYY